MATCSRSYSTTAATTTRSCRSRRPPLGSQDNVYIDYYSFYPPIAEGDVVEFAMMASDNYTYRSQGGDKLTMPAGIVMGMHPVT
jgi:hypothetical protein